MKLPALFYPWGRLKILLPGRQIYFAFKTKHFGTMAGNGHNVSLTSVREELRKFSGGQVDVVKDQHTGIATICFSNPSKKNAWTGTMMVQLADIVEDLEKWTTGKGLLLCSPGADFCSGADLSMVSHMVNSKGGRNMCTFMHDTLTRLSLLPLVSAVRVQGKAIGGGTELITVCDFRLVTSDLQFSMVHLKMGLITGWGGTTRLVRLLGPTAALRLMGSCAKLTANDALSLGLATSILNYAEDTVEHARSWLVEHLQGAPEVVHAMKLAVVHASTLSLKNSLEKECDLFASLWGGPANKQALEQNMKHK